MPSRHVSLNAFICSGSLVMSLGVLPTALLFVDHCQFELKFMPYGGSM